jgi:hypothetical protein
LKSREQTTAEGPQHEPAPEVTPQAALQAPLLRIQRAAGNQAVLRYLQRKCSCGGTCDACKSHGLPIGPTDDPHEREAEQTAEHVMSGGVLQRKCSQCKEEEEETRTRKLQRQEAGAGPATAPPVVHEVLNSPGRPLDHATRGFMEPRLGSNFGGVRIHTDSRAAESARSVSALAYTVGQDIVFASGQYSPESATGKRLLAHELTHVVQQQQWGGSGTLAASSSAPVIAGEHSAAEREAEALSHRVMAGQSVAGRRLAAPSGQMHRSVSISPTDPAAALLLSALTRLTGRPATATGGALALGNPTPGAAASSGTVTDYVQRAISASRAYTLQSGATTPGGTAVRGVRVETATSGGGVTITINAGDIGAFTWTADELVSEGIVNAVSANDRTTATFPAAPAPATPGAPAAPAPTNLDDLLAAPLPFVNGALRRRAMDLIKQRVPRVAADISLEVDVEVALQGGSGVTLAEVLRGLETNMPFRINQSIAGNRVEATYFDPRMTPGASEQQRIPRREVTFPVGPGAATPSGGPVPASGTPCSASAIAEITAHLANVRRLVGNAITLLSSTTNLDAPLIANFGPAGPANRARIAANYRLILSELTLERHGWICTPRGGPGCPPNITGTSSPGQTLVNLCIQTSAPFVPNEKTVLHEVTHCTGIGSLRVGSEIYWWQPGYPGTDPLHNADSYAQFPMAAATFVQLNPPAVPSTTGAPSTKGAPQGSPNPSSSSTVTPTGPPPVLQKTPLHGTEGMHHDIAESYRSRRGLPAGGRDQFGQQAGPTDAEIVYGGLAFPVPLSQLATMTPWNLAHEDPLRLAAPAGSTPPATDPTYDDYARARQVIRFLHNLKNLTYDYETDHRPAGREPTAAELQILDSNLSQLLSTFNVRSLVSGTAAGGRGVPTAPGGTTATLAGRARIVDSIGDFAGKRYQLERWAGADRFLNAPPAQLDTNVRSIWADPAVGVTAAPGARVTTAEMVAAVWFQGAMFSTLEPAFYFPDEDKFYLSSHVNLSTLEGQDTARHETVHLLAGRETTRQAFIAQFGTDWMKYWKPFEEGMAEFVNISSRTPAQIPPSAAGSGGIMSGYGTYYRKVQRLMALPGVGRDAVMQAYFTGRISQTMFQQWKNVVDTPP